jgi:hypothetical protein
MACLLLLACNGSIDAAPARPGPRTYAPGPAVLPRLTAEQYHASLEDLFGAGLPRLTLEPDTNPYLFFNVGAASTTLSEVGAQRYDESAHAIAAAVVDDPARRARFMGCEPASPGDRCVRATLGHLGMMLYRRPLSDEEAERWIAIATDLAEGNALVGLRYALAGMLQAPSFLYRIEVGAPEVVPGHPDWRRYSDLEMASRMAFLLWNAGPDEELIEAALAGQLSTPDEIHAQATRMLEDPRARRAVQAFFAQYFDLGRLDHVGDRDPARYPQFTPTLTASMRTEVELLVDDVIFNRDADVREILRTRRTFVNADLAALYDLDAYGVDAEGATAITFVPVELPDDGPRAGLLTLGAFLAMNAHPTETSPTLRGKYVRERLLCDLVPPPPDDVPTTIPEPGATPRTLRERLELHRSRPDCASCHDVIDPPGYLFEGFDSIGATRAEDHGIPVDTSGGLDGMPLSDGRDLGELLSTDPRVSLCITRQLFRHATGRLETELEDVAIRALAQDFIAGGSRFLDLLLSLVTSDAFRTIEMDGSER